MFLVGYSHPEPFPQAYDLTGSVSPRPLYPPELGDFQSTVFALPVVKGRLTDPVGATYIGYLHSGIGFLEDRHDLAFRESALFHWSLGCFPGPILYF